MTGERVPASVQCPNGGGAACPTCVGMCQRVPGWFSPTEAAAAIEAGYAGRLWIAFWYTGDTEGTTIEVLAAGEPWTGTCPFLTAAGLCELHHTGFKPCECRWADCTRDPGGTPRETIAAMWNTAFGRELVARWRSLLPAEDEPPAKPTKGPAIYPRQVIESPAAMGAFLEQLARAGGAA